MNALARARELVQDAYFDERGMADVMRSDAAIYAAIAQAEAARPRWVRIGDQVINLAQVAYVDLKSVAFNGATCARVGFASMSQEMYMELVFCGEDYQPAVDALNEALGQLVVAERNPADYGKDTDDEAEARTDYADPLN